MIQGTSVGQAGYAMMTKLNAFDSLEELRSRHGPPRHKSGPKCPVI